jgi:hypothetical protein
MAVQRISIPTYRTIFLQHEPSILSSLSLIRQFIRYGSLKSKLGAMWIVIGSIFVVSFSTISSAMTSYSSDMEPSILVNGSDSVLLANLYTVRYIIHDGWRVGKTADYSVPLTDQAGLVFYDGMASTQLRRIAY